MNSQEDFEGYMESMEQAKAQQKMLNGHQLWKETTWQGKAVGLLQSIGKRHFGPVFSWVADTLREEKSLGFRVFSHLIRISIVFVAIAVVYLLSHMLQALIGTDIEIEEEVVIIEEVRRSELDGERHDKCVTVEDKTGTPQRRSARTKKTQ